MPRCTGYTRPTGVPVPREGYNARLNMRLITHSDAPRGAGYARLLGRTLEIATAVSALFLVSAGAIWGRSYFRIDGFAVQYDKPHRSYLAFVSEDGAAGCIQCLNWAGGADFRTLQWHSLRVGRHAAWFLDTPPKVGSSAGVVFAFPWWSCALATGVLPGVWLARAAMGFNRSRRWTAGHCRACGYDLRATPERCPECGEGAVSSDPGMTP